MKDNEGTEPLPPTKNFEPSIKLQNWHVNNSLSKPLALSAVKTYSSITEKLIQYHFRLVFYSHVKINL